MFTEKTKKSTPKRPTKTRLKNIALYYLQRFESSEHNLREVLKRRIDKYAFFDKEYSPIEAYQWIDEILEDCLKHNYVNDERFAGFKIESYLRSGKPRRYIEQKLKQKGIDDKIIDKFFDENEYSEYETALRFAQKKKIGRFRPADNICSETRQKDLVTLVRAGFDFDVAKKVLDDE